MERKHTMMRIARTTTRGAGAVDADKKTDLQKHQPPLQPGP